MKIFETKVTMDNVKINLIKPMTNSPFTVKEDEDMQKLRESISQFGLLSPKEHDSFPYLGLTNYRIEQLEKKVDKLNSVIERTTELETWKESINHEIKEMKETINTLLTFHLRKDE